MRITDHTSTLLYDESPDSKLGHGTRPEVDRTQLRSLLLESIPQNIIKWGHKVEEAKEVGDGT